MTMDWKAVLTACGFQCGETTDVAYFHLDDSWGYWAIQVLNLRIHGLGWRASLSFGNQSNAHEDTIAEAEGETADAAFLALLKAKFGPGGVSVFQFIGADVVTSNISINKVEP